MTFEDRVFCVKTAIDRIDLAQTERIDLEMDPASTGDQRTIAVERFKRCEEEFAWQWRNVKEILKVVGAERQIGE